MDMKLRAFQRKNLPWALLWLALLVVSGLHWVWPASSPPLAWTPRGFDRERFLAQAANLPARAQLDAADYAKQIDAIARSPRSPHELAQMADNFGKSRFSFASDMAVWGVLDYWTAPLEFFERGRGDCEDYAIAAYEMLRAAGAPSSDLRMAYGRIVQGGHSEPHMVALLADGDDYWVIDNTRMDVTRLSERQGDLSIVFSFDNEWIYDGVGKSTHGSSTGRLAKWRDVLNKARSEGFD